MNPKPKNFRKIPEELLRKAERINSPTVVAACVKRFNETELSRGDLAHLGIIYRDNALLVKGGTVLPSPYAEQYGNA
jgi:hypothetical protein